MAPATAPPHCTYCGRRLGTAWHVSALGAPFCRAHRDLSPCRICAAPATADFDGRLCTACAQDGVWAPDDSRREIPGIRQDMHALGIWLNTPVKVTLLDPSGMAARHGRSREAAGLTMVRGDHVLSISILRGLVRREFGAAVAHEFMHAWLAQNGFPEMSDRLAEGLCQAMAYRYLRRHQDEDRARLLARAISEDPDPVYGDGFRMVRANARRIGFAQVVETVRRTGRLP